MSQRDSGYKRKELDSYETPEWVTEALIPHLRHGITQVWEPACGSGKMVKPLSHAFSVWRTDIVDCKKHNFLTMKLWRPFDAIITNPPYALAQEFIERSINLMAPQGLVAMLLRTDFDHAKCRKHLFGDCRQFSKKLVLTKRIQWFEHSTAQPSFNHAWFIWDHRHHGPPTIAYH